MSASFATPEGLRAVLERLHDRERVGYWGWRQDREAERLMQFTIRKYRSLARTHHCEPEDSAYAAFEAMRTRAVRCADDPWAVITRAVQVSLIAEERAAGLLCSTAQARRREVMRHHDARRFGEDETGFLELLAETRGPSPVDAAAAPPPLKPGETPPTRAFEALNLVISMFVALGWPVNSATCTLDYIATRLMEAGNRHVAHSYLRRDQAGRAALDLDRESWATVLRIVLGNPDKSAAATRAGVGVLAMLVCAWTRPRSPQQPDWNGTCRHRRTTRRGGARAMKIPVVLSVVHVAIDADGVMTVDVNGVPRDSGQSRTRGDLRAVIDEITSDLGAPVRVEVRGADRSTYSDIATPPNSPAPAATEPSPTTSTPLLAGAGFQPGEEVALVYVVVRQNADAAGNASLNLPPALLAATRGGLVLLGMSSRTVTPFEAPA